MKKFTMVIGNYRLNLSIESHVNASINKSHAAAFIYEL